MGNQIKSVKGMHDLLPEAAETTRYLENTLIKIANSYGYSELRTPLLEQLNLFVRSVGATSDIVHKEMYSFEDQNGDLLALRPEGTAACVRAGIEHALFYGKKQRLWYLGNMFRRERPQKGRFRQFSQFGLEALGFAEPYIEVEIISLVSQILAELKINSTLELNHLGSNTVRSNFTKNLVAYLEKYKSELDADSQRRLSENPLRILDSKVKSTQEILQQAPSIADFFDANTQAQLDFIGKSLTNQGIEYKINHKLVRGLDYYTGAVFEWQNNLTLCAGGRYDNLVEDLGGKPNPAVGIAMGLERLVAALSNQPAKTPKIALLCNHESAYGLAVEYAKKLRANIKPSVLLEYNPDKLKPMLKLANQNNCDFVIIIGEQELQANIINCKNLNTGIDVSLNNIDELINFLEKEYARL